MTWEQVKIGELCEIEMGRTPSRAESKYWGTGHAWVSIADMGRAKYLEQTKEQITDEGLKSFRRGKIDPGTVLFSFKLSIGKVAITAIPLVTNEAIVALPIKDKTRLDTDFLFWVLQNLDVSGDVDRAGKGLTLNKEKLNNLEIPLPPLPVQRRIAAVLDEVDALRQKRERSIERLTQLLDATLIQKIGDPIKGLYRYDTRPGKTVYKLSSGKFFKREDHSGNGSIPAYGGAGITGWADTPNIHMPTVVIGRVGFHCGNVQAVNEPAFITDNAIYIKELQDDFLMGFIHHFLRLSQLNRFRDPGDLKKITQKPLEDLAIPVVPLAEQRELLQGIADLEAMLSEARKSGATLELLASSLQARAFAGELALRDFN